MDHHRDDAHREDERDSVRCLAPAIVYVYVNMLLLLRVFTYLLPFGSTALRVHESQDDGEEKRKQGGEKER